MFGSFRRALHFKRVKSWCDLPESRRIETRRDVAFQQVAEVQAARFGLRPFPDRGAF